jgi:hypothetical protein
VGGPPRLRVVQVPLDIPVHSEEVDPLRDVALERQLAGPVEEHVDDDALGSERSELHVRSPGMPALLVVGGLGEQCRTLALVRAVRLGEAGHDPCPRDRARRVGRRARAAARLRGGLRPFRADAVLLHRAPGAHARLPPAGAGVAPATAACGRRADGGPRRAKGGVRRSGAVAQSNRVRPARPPGRTARAVFTMH